MAHDRVGARFDDGRQLAHRLFRPLALGDVGRHPDEAGELSVVVEERRIGDEGGKRCAVATEYFHISRPTPPGDQFGEDRFQAFCHLGGGRELDEVPTERLVGGPPALLLGGVVPIGDRPRRIGDDGLTDGIE